MSVSDSSGRSHNNNKIIGEATIQLDHSESLPLHTKSNGNIANINISRTELNQVNGLSSGSEQEEFLSLSNQSQNLLASHQHERMRLISLFRLLDPDQRKTFDKRKFFEFFKTINIQASPYELNLLWDQIIQFHSSQAEFNSPNSLPKVNSKARPNSKKPDSTPTSYSNTGNSNSHNYPRDDDSLSLSETLEGEGEGHVQDKFIFDKTKFFTNGRGITNSQNLNMPELESEPEPKPFPEDSERERERELELELQPQPVLSVPKDSRPRLRPLPQSTMNTSPLPPLANNTKGRNHKPLNNLNNQSHTPNESPMQPENQKKIARGKKQNQAVNTSINHNKGQIQISQSEIQNLSLSGDQKEKGKHEDQENLENQENLEKEKEKEKEGEDKDADILSKGYPDTLDFQTATISQDDFVKFFCEGFLTGPILRPSRLIKNFKIIESLHLQSQKNRNSAALFDGHSSPTHNQNKTNNKEKYKGNSVGNNNGLSENNINIDFLNETFLAYIPDMVLKFDKFGRSLNDLTKNLIRRGPQGSSSASDHSHSHSNRSQRHFSRGEGSQSVSGPVSIVTSEQSLNGGFESNSYSDSTVSGSGSVSGSTGSSINYFDFVELVNTNSIEPTI